MKTLLIAPNLRNNLSLFFIVLFITSFNSFLNAQQLAFPSAYGAGAYTTGGRGGKVVHVTSLLDILDQNDPNYVGTLRWALKGAENKGVPRTIVFDVSGIIDLQSDMYISNGPGDEGGYADGITIAGQTAPEGGITITGGKIKIVAIGQVIIRYLKFRETASYDGCLSLSLADNYILDHLSGSHTGDIVFSVTANGEGASATDHTIQNCLMGNSKNGLIIGNSDFAQGATSLPYGSVSVLRNAFYSVSWRVPGKFGGSGNFDVINNVAHNWKSRLMRFDPYNYKLNHIGNHYQSGGQSRTRSYPNLHKTWTGYNNMSPQIYQDDNYYSEDVRNNDYNHSNQWSVFQGDDDEIPNPDWFIDNQLPIQGRPLPILGSDEIFDDVLEFVGASKYIKDDGTVGFYRDQYDTFQVNGIAEQDVFYSSERNIELPVISISNTRPSDFYISNDHIPEVWFSTNVPNGQDHDDIAPSGYTWLEEYLNQVDNNNTEAVAAEGVNISPESYDLAEGLTLQLNKNFTPSNTTNQSGEWASSDTAIATVNSNGLVTAIAASDTPVIITFTSLDGGFTDTSQITVFIEALQASAGSDQSICQGDFATLTASGGSSYLWSTGETTASIEVSPNETTTYSVTVSNSSGQEDTVSVEVVVSPTPNVIIDNGDSVNVLYGDFVTLSASGANNYEWNNGATQPNIAVSPTQTTTYEVKGYINDCYEEKGVTVNVFEPVDANAGENVSICPEETVALTATGGDEYLWSTGDTTATIEVEPSETTEYTVTVFNEVHFDEASVWVEVDNNCGIENADPELDDLDFDLMLYPNPADDFVNLKISNPEELSEYYIYNFTGELVMHNEIINENANLNVLTTQIDLSILQNGMYYIKLVGSESEKIKKLIIRGY
ncbi:Ig-like domain-containing protein [Winogradskyella ursingii]|uniref:Ig-like domain-containing protein n=1 Tax=Winogradskyella ursingii TaxID=2686079 RepID=UPI0015C7C248|nr:Ig-like domain-containing protein [Winogradskyella ursingii]